jgi:hypothetical protein
MPIMSAERANMSKLAKIVIILGAAALLMAARQSVPTYSAGSTTSFAARDSVSPHEMMRTTGPLPQTIVDNYY